MTLGYDSVESQWVVHCHALSAQSQGQTAFLSVNHDGFLNLIFASQWGKNKKYNWLNRLIFDL